VSETHTIPDHIAANADRLINEAEDMRRQGADSLKQIYADLRDDLKEMGWSGSVISAEVAAFKSAIAELRMDEKAKTKREEKGERAGDYVSLLTRARAREARSSTASKPMQKLHELPPHDETTGEVFEDQPDTKSVADDQVRSEVASSSSAGTVVGCGNEPAASSSDAIACANPKSTGALLAGFRASPEHAFDKSPATNSMQEPHDEAEGQGGVIEHRREEGSQPRLPSDRAEITPDAPAVIAGDTNSNPSEPTSSPDRDGPDAGAAVSGSLSAMNARTKADVIRLLRPFCRHADDLENCPGQGSKHCVTCEKLKSAATQALPPHAADLPAGLDAPFISPAGNRETAI
jgi:hypothetical protein